MLIRTQIGFDLSETPVICEHWGTDRAAFWAPDYSVASCGGCADQPETFVWQRILDRQDIAAKGQ